MRLARSLRLAAAAGLGATALTVVGVTAPAQARVADPGASCLTPTPGAAAGARGGATGLDHRGISAAEQRAIARRTSSRLAAKGAPSLRSTALARTVPVHFHVMRDAAGRGNVTNRQIARQMAVLNHDFAGTGFRFNLATTHRYNNTAWHRDSQSARYRALTRKGGANALNIWLVDFQFLGVATFPWDYAKKRADRRHPRQLRLSARRQHRQLQPGRDRDARGGPLVRSLPHLPGRLHRPQRPGR